MAVTVNYATAANTAANGTDYTHITGTLTFAPGEITKTISVPIINDANPESIENFFLNLSAPSANAKISDNFAFATIIDNDAAKGVPVVNINDFVVDEAGKEATFVITLDKPSLSVVTMSYATQNGTALAGSDFTAARGSLSFAPGEMAKTVKVTLLNDIAPEAFNLVLSAITNATTLDPVGTAIIAENDAPQVLVSNISVDDIVVDESQTYTDFLVRLDAPNTGTVTVHYATAKNTAANGTDYMHITGDLTFAAGETVKTVRIPIIPNDTTPSEPVENFQLVLSAASANSKISDNSANATIIDNDALSGVPVASITDAIVDEANQTVTVSVILDKPSVGNVTFNVAGQSVTAVEGSDFRSFPFGKVTFAPGEMVKTITFGLLNDTIAENAELFDVVLSSPVGATLA